MMKRYKILNVLLLLLKVILPILILIPLVFVSYRLVEARISDIANAGNESYHSGSGLYIFASHTLLFAANGILTIIGGIGWLIAKKYKSSPIYRKNLMTFRCLTFAPLVSQLLYVLIIVIVMNIGAT